jgi:PAS domain S-box-containing protein
VLIDVNEAWVLQFGRSREMAIGRSAQELRLWANESEFTEIDRMSRLGHDRVEAWLLDVDQRRLLCEFSARPVVIEGKTLAIWVIRDITDRRRTEEQIRANNLMLEGVTRAQREFILETDPRRGFDGILALLLETTSSEYGFIGEVFWQPSGKPFLKTHAITNIAWNEETTGWFEKNAPAGLEFHNLNTLFGAVMTKRETVIANDPAHDPRRGGLPVGHPPLRGFLGIPFFHGERMIGMVGLANRVRGYDESVMQNLAPILTTCSSLVLAYSLVRERKLGEEKLRNALAEKEVLLKEVYHRVKNNLQVVSSLLSLQSRRVADAEVRQLLDGSANRVKSMALVHEQLYRAGNLSSIGLPEYLKELTDNLGIANHPLSTHVPLRLEVDPLTLGVESAIPLGLVINELVSNAYRHAYAADAPSGEIVVRLKASQDGQVSLEVRDDGCGLPRDFQPDKVASLGLRLVETLAQQLRATVTWDTSHRGTCFVLQFSVETSTVQPAKV